MGSPPLAAEHEAARTDRAPRLPAQGDACRTEPDRPVVVDQHGCERGSVHEVHEGSAADLLVLDTGHLVPVTFVVGKEPGRVLVEAPEGLWELLGS